MNKYNWKGINCPSEKDIWKMLSKNNLTIVLNVLYEKEMEICPAYISKQNSNLKKQIIFIMISNFGGWHYLAIILSCIILRIFRRARNEYN